MSDVTVGGPHRRLAPITCAGLLLLVTMSACNSSRDSTGPSAASSSVAVSTEAAAPAQRASSYERAIGEVNAWLALWVSDGAAAAAVAYLSADEQPPSGVSGSAGSELVSGVVRSYEPWTWNSPNAFGLEVTLDLHFRSSDAGGNWNDGVNTRFFTFEKVTGAVTYRMYVSTGP